MTPDLPPVSDRDRLEHERKKVAALVRFAQWLATTKRDA